MKSLANFSIFLIASIVLSSATIFYLFTQPKIVRALCMCFMIEVSEDCTDYGKCDCGTYPIDCSAPCWYFCGMGECKYECCGECATTTTTSTSTTTTTAPADTCTYSTGDWNVDCSDWCNITSAVDVMGNDINITGEGRFWTNVSISNYTKLTIQGDSPTNRCRVVCSGGCFKG